MGKMVIYTCMVGEYDDLRQPEKIDPRLDYICFSNTLSATAIGAWKILPFPYHHAMLTRESRFPKLQPHRVLPEYEYSLYIDANQRLTEALQDRYLELVEKRSVCAMLVHPERDCIYQEAHCLTMIVNDGVRGFINVVRMVLLLCREKYPEHNGLICGCCIFRKHNDPAVREFSNLWWQIYQHYSHRDQMSANYVLWKLNMTPDLLWGKEFYYSFRIHHKNYKRNMYQLTPGKRLLSYFLLFILRVIYVTCGISWSSWVELDPDLEGKQPFRMWFPHKEG